MAFETQHKILSQGNIISSHRFLSDAKKRNKTLSIKLLKDLQPVNSCARRLILSPAAVYLTMCDGEAQSDLTILRISISIIRKLSSRNGHHQTPLILRSFCGETLQCIWFDTVTSLLHFERQSRPAVFYDQFTTTLRFLQHLARPVDLCCTRKESCQASADWRGRVCVCVNSDSLL